MKKHFNSKGFSLAEIMIAGAILGGLSLVAMQITKNVTKSTAKASFDTDVLQTTNEINAMLTDPAKCLATFQSAISPLSINNGATQKFYVKGQAGAPAQGYGNAGLEIASYTLSSPAANEGRLVIVYNNKNILKGQSGPSTITKRITLYIEGTPGSITKCRAMSSATSDIWTRGSGAYSNDIYYTQGRVGIGTSEPASLLETVFDNVTAGITNDVVISRYENTNDWSPITFRRFRGTRGAPANVQSGDWLGGILDHVRIGGVETATTYVKTAYVGNGTNNLSNMYIGTSNTERMIIDYQGFVGIGTSTPGQRLEVNGGIRSIAGEPTGSNISAAGFSFDGDSGMFSSGDGYVNFWSNNIKTMTVYQGNVSVPGNVAVTNQVTANSFAYTSDQRLKENVKAITNSEEKIMNLRPVKFQWKNNKKSDYGFIAQEVNKVIPEITSKDERDIVHVDYAKIVPFLVSTIQKQQKQIEKQQKQIEALEEKLK